MTVYATTFNKEGHWIEHDDRPCFGFMSYINQWDRNDISDHDVGDKDIDDLCSWDEEGITGFESKNLKTLRYEEYCGCGAPDREKSKAYFDKVVEACKALPQFYENFEFGEWAGTSSRTVIDIELPGYPMQQTIVGAMMFRNIFQYSGFGCAFRHLIDNGVEPKVAFIVSQIFPRTHGSSLNKSTHYQALGDESIFDTKATVADVKNILKGGIGDNWQGNWGDSEAGYGRYGQFENEDITDRNRLGNKKTLKDITMMLEAPKDSPRLDTFLDIQPKNSYDSPRMSEESFDKFLKLVLED